MGHTLEVFLQRGKRANFALTPSDFMRCKIKFTEDWGLRHVEHSTTQLRRFLCEVAHCRSALARLYRYKIMHCNDQRGVGSARDLELVQQPLGERANVGPNGVLGPHQQIVAFAGLQLGIE
jgi:hypothetical protein